MFGFRIDKELDNGLGRAGVITTPHGEIRTPAFMVVGTKGYVRYVSADQLREIGAQAMLSNGYHLRKKSEEIARGGGLAAFSGWGGPTLTDSGGFQVMSLGSGFGKVVSMKRMNEGVGRKPARCLGVSGPDKTLSPKKNPRRIFFRGAPCVLPPETALRRSPDFGPNETATPNGPLAESSSVGDSSTYVGHPFTASSNHSGHRENHVKIAEAGVEFRDPETGELDFIGPEESMAIQGRIGADIMMGFDELTSIADDYGYNVKAMERTHRWAERCLKHVAENPSDPYQALYGVLQGGRWEDLRRQTARFLGEMRVSGREFDGFGLGGAFLKEDLGEILRWCNEELPREKPRHLLGLSRPDDIFVGAEMGADTFDCVAPTREARHGRIYTKDGDINLRKFRDSNLLLDEGCDCATCQEGWTRGRLRELMKSQDSEEKEQYYSLASVHNVRFIVRLTEGIRASMIEGRFYGFRDEFLARYYGKDGILKA